jgi:hypothetical protein
MDPVLLQKQVLDNAEDLRSYMQDLKNWEADMKRKESELHTTVSGDQVCVLHYRFYQEYILTFFTPIPRQDSASDIHSIRSFAKAN